MTPEPVPEQEKAAAVTTLPPGVAAAADYERLARHALPADVFAHIAGGAGTERTLRANRRAFARVQIVPRVLRTAAGASACVNLLGRERPHPFLLAPVALQRMLHPAGELAVADGASAVDAPVIVSTLASYRIEHIARRARAGCWFQLYAQPREADTLRLLQRAQDAGCEAIVLTVDAPVTSGIPRAQRRGFQPPAHVRAVNLDDLEPPTISPRRGDSRVFAAAAHAPDWALFARIVACTPLPVLVKGVLHPDDAVKAHAAGARGVVVSNHGGRALDGAPAALDCLPAVRAALPSDATVLFDSGVRSGMDAFIALALGADAVLAGRLPSYALAVGGALGVAHLVRTLREEFELAMVLAGCRTVADVRQATLRTIQPGAPW